MPTIGNCHMCFKHAEIAPILPNSQAKVCRACAYKANQVIGFMEFYGCKVIYQPTLGSEVTPLPPKQTRKAKKKETGDKSPDKS